MIVARKRNMQFDTIAERGSILVGMGASFLATKLEMTHMMEVFIYGASAAAGSYIGTQTVKYIWTQIATYRKNRKTTTNE